MSTIHLELSEVLNQSEPGLCISLEEASEEPILESGFL